MKNIFEKAERLIEAAKNICKDKYRIEDVQLYEEYAEPGYSSSNGIIATGNWNTITKWNNETNKSDLVDDTPARLAKALEKLGVDLEWSDEWTSCSECNGLVRTHPDCYGWTPSYSMGDGEITCHNCIDPEDHLESLEGNYSRANTIDKIDPAEHGYILVKDDYQHGFYEGQDASPELIAKALEEQGITRYLFNIDGVGQFDVKFSVYVHKSEKDLLNKEDFEEVDTDGPSVAGALKRGLMEASVKMAKLNGDGIKYASVNSDGTADVRLVSPEEFIEGIKR